MNDNSLVIFTRAALMLAEADTIQKAKELKSLALTAAEWAKRKNMGEEAIQHCRSYAFEAERKMGEMLAATAEDKSRTVRGGDRKSKSPEVTLKPTLSELGVTKRESAEAQKLAAGHAAGGNGKRAQRCRHVADNHARRAGFSTW